MSRSRTKIPVSSTPIPINAQGTRVMSRMSISMVPREWMPGSPSILKEGRRISKFRMDGLSCIELIVCQLERCAALLVLCRILVDDKYTQPARYREICTSPGRGGICPSWSTVSNKRTSKEARVSLPDTTFRMTDLSRYFLVARDWARSNYGIYRRFPFGYAMRGYPPEDDDQGFEENHDTTEYDDDNIGMVVKVSFAGSTLSTLLNYSPPDQHSYTVAQERYCASEPGRWRVGSLHSVAVCARSAWRYVPIRRDSCARGR